MSSRITVFCFVIAALTLGMPSSFAAEGSLEGFSLEGQNWTLQEGETPLSGILLKPEGDGPFPAIIISHGMGGSAQGFALPKAEEMVKWGFVCIATSYTHAGRAEYTGEPRARGPQSATRPARGQQATRPARQSAAASRPQRPRDAGASPENLRRAGKCVEILKSLPYVDQKRICAYGNSMGAFLTIAMAAEMPDDIAAAAITAGGIRPGGGGEAASPDANRAQNIRCPFIIFHGTADGTVRPEMSEALEEILDQNNVPNERILFEGVGHNAHRDNADEIYSKMRAFFSAHGILTDADGSTAQ